MPKPTRNPNGTMTLHVSHCMKRVKLTLGKISNDDAHVFSANISRLKDARNYGVKQLPYDLQAWLEMLSDRHLKQLSDLGLIDFRTCSTVGDLLDAYAADYEKRADVADSTKRKVRSAMKNRTDPIRSHELSDVEPTLLSFRRNAEPIWSEDAKRTLSAFNSWQRNHYSVATWSRDNKMFSSVGIWAVKSGFCEFNPFSILPVKSMVNEERNEYIDRSSVVKVMDSCLSSDVRLTLAMGRFAGLRTPSEVTTIKWSHVDFKNAVLTIVDSKKKKPRTMPLFDDIRFELERQQIHTGETKFVASAEMRNSSSANNFNGVRDAMKRAGLKPWPRARQNLRSSCLNDLLEHFSEREVTRWLGHSASVSRDHYQKPRPGDYQAAIELVRTGTA